ncbi:MAG: DUF6152 family protein [Gammaproteobacteria bacterium]|nr:DUF6152 family protein [Gammaproteobacteria bacterium]
MNSPLKRLLAVTTACIATPPAFSHHSSAPFDPEAPATITGVVTAYEWANPHGYISVRAEGDAPGAEPWVIEGGPPNLLRRAGWAPTTLREGDRVSLAVFSARDPESRAAFLAPSQSADGLLADTRPYFEAVTDAAPIGAAESIFGVWAGVRAPAAMASAEWPLTDAARRQLDAFRDIDSPSVDCTPLPAPSAMTFPDFKQIENAGDTIVIRSGFDNTVRTVAMTDSAAPGNEYSVHGYSVGRWDGGVLIIETSRFETHRSGNGFGIPSSRSKRLVERLSLDDGGQSLSYEFELTDPEIFTEPVIRQMTWVYRSDVSYAADECDPDNARRFLDY